MKDFMSIDELAAASNRNEKVLLHDKMIDYISDHQQLCDDDKLPVFITYILPYSNGHTYRVDVVYESGDKGHFALDRRALSIHTGLPVFKRLSQTSLSFEKVDEFIKENVELGEGILGDGLTMLEKSILDRWGPMYELPDHCKRCGSRTGCFCPRSS